MLTKLHTNITPGQFLSCVTIVHGSDELIRVIGSGHPVVIAILRKNLIGSKFNHVKLRGGGGSFDGQYFHLNIDTLESRYDLQPTTTLLTWDAMHKSGLVDTHLCKDAKFLWLVDDTDPRGRATSICWGCGDVPPIRVYF